MSEGREVPAGRTPGRYIVYGFVGLMVVLFGVSAVLAVKLEPAAERFRRPPAAVTAPTGK